MAVNKQLLDEYNITQIVKCAMEILPRFPNDDKYLNLRIHNELGKDAFPMFDKAIDFIDEGMKEGYVYVHWYIIFKHLRYFSNKRSARNQYGNI